MKTLWTLLCGVCLVGCSAPEVRVDPVEPPNDFSLLPAIWAHDLHITRFAEDAPGAYCIQSMIRDESAVRYMVLIKVAKLDVAYITEQRSPDGTELETLAMKLSAGDSSEELVAEFTHTLETNGVETLRFSGKTIVPRFD